jgi:hypothetical protein
LGNKRVSFGIWNWKTPSPNMGNHLESEDKVVKLKRHSS